MAKWTKQPKQTNNSLPLVAANKKITSAEFNELTQIINDNFDATVAPIDVVYGKKGEDWVVIPAGGGLTIAEIVTGLEALTGSSRLDAASLKNLIAYIDALQGNANWRETLTFLNGLAKDANGNVGLAGNFAMTGSNTDPSRTSYLSFSDQNFNAEFYDDGGNVSNQFEISVNGFGLGTDKFIFSLSNNNLFLADNRVGANKQGLRLVGFQGNFSTLVGESLVPRQFVEDITGLLTALNTTNKTSLVAAINEILAGGGGGGLTIAEIVTGIEALAAANRLDYNALKNRPDLNTLFSNGLTESNGAVKLGGAITEDTVLLNQSQAIIQFLDNVLEIGNYSLSFQSLVSGFFFGGQNSTPYQLGPFVTDLQYKVIFNDKRGITQYNDGSGGSTLPGVKAGIQYYNFEEEDEDGTGANYSTLLGTSLVPRKFVEDITGLLTALNTTNKNSLVAAINEVLAGGGGSYTDAEARAAQASLLTTGTSILFDRPRYYGYPTAVSTNITFDFTGAVSGQAQHIRVNASTKPTLPSSIRLLSGGFVPDVINDYYLTPWLISSSPDVWVVHVTISQENDY